MKQVTVYTTPECQICKRVKDYLTTRNISYVEKNVDDEAMTAELVGLTGRSVVPVVVVDEEYATGYDLEHIDRLVGLASEPASPDLR